MNLPELQPTDLEGVCVFCGGEEDSHDDDCEFVLAVKDYEQVKAERDELAVAIRLGLIAFKDHKDTAGAYSIMQTALAKLEAK